MGKMIMNGNSILPSIYFESPWHQSMTNIYFFNAQERRRGLKKSFTILKMEMGFLQESYEEEAERIEEKKKEYRGIIAQLRKENK